MAETGGKVEEARLDGDMLFQRQGPIAWLTINRPKARNAMTFAMYEELVRICDELEADESFRVLVLTGAGDRAFVSGTDINQFKTFTDPEHALDYESRIGEVINRLGAFKRPTIAVIRGYAVGGGAAMAMACDLRLCTPDAKFGVPIARTLGNTLSTGALARLVDLAGPARTKELLFTARMITADEASQIGIVNEVVEPDQLEARANELAATIAANAPITIQTVKEGVRRILDYRSPERFEDLILQAYMSEDFKEGVNSFLEKRKPEWKGC